MKEDAEGMDRLGMDGDFLGGRDGEFNYEGRRERERQTRDDLYGVFAEGDSDYYSEEDEGSRRRKRRRDESESDFTRPVQFVPKGIPERVEQRPGLGQAASSSRTAAARSCDRSRRGRLVWCGRRRQ
ncbi:hypothetical protein ZWY2020_029774 [Hordeum vulgare]|nr:hypothetical protein ZWY2020_029774 [Hordeum vulgare]